MAGRGGEVSLASLQRAIVASGLPWRLAPKRNEPPPSVIWLTKVIRDHRLKREDIWQMLGWLNARTAPDVVANSG